MRIANHMFKPVAVKVLFQPGIAEFLLGTLLESGLNKKVILLEYFGISTVTRSKTLPEVDLFCITHNENLIQNCLHYSAHEQYILDG